MIDLRFRWWATFRVGALFQLANMGMSAFTFAALNYFVPVRIVTFLNGMTERVIIHGDVAARSTIILLVVWFIINLPLTFWLCRAVLKLVEAEIAVRSSAVASILSTSPAEHGDVTSAGNAILGAAQ